MHDSARFKSAADIQDALKLHEYMWIGDGPSLERGIATGHGKIPGPMPGQEVWIQNRGLPERPDWRYVIYQDGECACINWHFASAQAALLHAFGWTVSSDQRPRLRLIPFYRSHVAYTVDGLMNGESVHIVETSPGRWHKKEVLANGQVDWLHDERWLTPMHVLTL